MSAVAARWSCAPYSSAAADQVARELGVSPTLASILVRRGCETPAAARRFLAAKDRHDPRLLAGAERACELIVRHARRGSRIVVHGDYDVDGVCSTAVLVEALRALGCDPSWHLPERAEGYGLSRMTVERLAAQGTALLVTVDCGVTSGGEVDAAHALGVDVVVVDHHRPGERLPACPVVHPALAPYPFAGLCATAVAHKLSLALRERAGLDPAAADAELDLVALATVCDLVPLRDENRALVRAGLAALARTERPGLRELMRVAALEPREVDERALGFRLGPRLNAAGRLRRADAALELLLTADPARAAEVADELDLLNRERRDVETRILFAAEQQRTEQEHQPAYVLAGEGWHPGVVGIVASRMTERHHRPCFVVALEGEGGRGSGRSIAAFDLHAALGACSHHLRRFGGHRAAAGFEIERDRLTAFREDLVRHAAGVLAPEDLAPVQEVDAVVAGSALGLELAEELRSLGPFGHGNPEPTLLVPGARIADARPMGQDGQHARFRLASGAARAEAVAFRTTAAALGKAGAEPCDAAVRLELNEWNGRVEARVALVAACPPEPGACVTPDGAPEQGFWAALERELDSDAAGREPTPLVSLDAGGSGREPRNPGGHVVRDRDGRELRDPGGRALRDRRGEGIAGLTGELLSSGEPVLLVCADVERRRAGLAATVAGLSPPRPRFADATESPAATDVPGTERAADARSPDAAGGSREVAVASWDALLAEPGLARPFVHLIALDPPPARAALRAAAVAPAAAGTGFCHLAWGQPEIEFARRVARAGLDLRGPLIEAYRRLREAGAAAGDDLARILAGSGSYPRSPAVCARLLRVLAELGVVELQRGSEGFACRVVEAPRTALDRSAAHRAHRARLEEVERYLADEEQALAGAGERPRTPPAAAPGPAAPGAVLA